MPRRYSIVLKVVLCATLTAFSAVVCFAPLSSADLIKLAGTRDVEIRGPLNYPSPPGFERVNFEALKHYAGMYGIDYRLVLAIIKQESQFDSAATSDRGAKGYMQIMPVTDTELRGELDLPGLELPAENIRAGIYYFSKLYSLFPGAGETDRLSLALAAYNAGPSRIYDAQELAAYIGEDAGAWASVESILPLLSKRYYSLHRTVWAGGRPPSGYFGEARQTIDYVHSVLRNYAAYQSTM